jgi:hypothetical protein
MPFEQTQGVEFKFNNVAYRATSISVSKSQGELNATTTEITNNLPRYEAGGLKSLEIKVDWVGSELPPTDDVYDIVFAGSGPGAGSGLAGESLSGKKALCTGLTITAQAGELIKGSATFKVSED